MFGIDNKYVLIGGVVLAGAALLLFKDQILAFASGLTKGAAQPSSTPA